MLSRDFTTLRQNFIDRLIDFPRFRHGLLMRSETSRNIMRLLFRRLRRQPHLLVVSL